MSLIYGTTGIGNFDVPDERPKTYLETTFKVVPDITPFFNLTSKLGEEIVNDMEYRVFEEGLVGAPLKVDGAQTNVDTTIELDTAVESEPAKAVRVGTFLRNTRTNEILRVSTAPVAPWTSIVVDARGTWAEVDDKAAMNDHDTLEILTTGAGEGQTSVEPISDKFGGGWNFLEDVEDSFEVTDWVDNTELRPKQEREYNRNGRRAMERFKKAVEKDLFWGKKKLNTVGGRKVYRTNGVRSFLTTNVFDDSSTGTSIDRVMEIGAQMRSYGQGSDTRWGMAGVGAITRLALLIQKNTTMNMSISDPLDRKGTWGITCREFQLPTIRLQLMPCPTLSETEDNTNSIFLLDPKYIKRAALKGIGALKREDNIKKDDGYRGKKGRYRAVIGLVLGCEKVHGFWKVGQPKP
jgi:hypothetical protein